MDIDAPLFAIEMQHSDLSARTVHDYYACNLVGLTTLQVTNHLCYTTSLSVGFRLGSIASRNNHGLDFVPAFVTAM